MQFKDAQDEIAGKKFFFEQYMLAELLRNPFSAENGQN